MKIKLTESQAELLKSGTLVCTPEDELYYYFPYWIKEANGEYELIAPEKLPLDIKEILNNERQA